MAQIFLNFADDTIGTVPAGLTAQWAAGGSAEVIESTDISSEWAAVAGTKSFSVPAASNTRQAWSFAADYDPQAEVRAVIRPHLDPASNFNIGALYLRCSGTTDRTGYILWVRPTSGAFRILRSINNTELALASGTLGTYTSASDDNAYNALFRATDVEGGVLLEAWVWPYGTTQPETPSLSVTNTSSTLTSGWSGVGSISGSTYTQTFGWASIGTAGDAAPTAPVGGSDTALVGAASVTATASASLTTSATLAAVAACAVIASGALTTNIALASSAPVTVSAYAALMPNLAWTVGPAVTAITQTGATITATPNQACTVYAVALRVTQTKGTSLQISNGTDAADVAAAAFGSQVSVAGEEVSIVLTGLIHDPVYNFGVVAELPA